MAVQEIRVPDLEGSENVGVVEVYVSAGDSVEEESPLISLESDKAVMDVPAPFAGTIRDVKVSEGDTVNTGDLIALAETDGDGAADGPAGEEAGGTGSDAADSAGGAESEAGGRSGDDAGSAGAEPDPGSPPPSPPVAKAAEKAAREAPVNRQEFGAPSHATPSVRGLARELGVDLTQVTGSGPKGRVTREDLTSMVKGVMSGAAPTGGGSFALPPIPTADFGAFGPVETEELSRIKKISGPHLHRNWVGVPHVTQFEDADITELEAYRKTVNAENERRGRPKLSPLIFVIKAAVEALKAFPDFNSSLAPDGASVIRKAYYNIGIAVDTPGGLVVPVIRDADRKGVQELAEELGDLSERARGGKLKGDELKGGTFSISSLGGIGGTYFTPIVNAPETAILGLSRSAMRPVWNGTEFVPRLILPFSVSYDHRVIDGAEGARFAVYLSSLLGDMRRALL